MTRSAVARRWLYPEPGDTIRIHGRDGLHHKRFIVRNVSEALIVHAFELENEQKARLRSFDVMAVEVLGR